jgi:surfeit locus 1 family protein
MEMRDRRREARLEREKEALELTKKRWHNPHPIAWIFIIIAVGTLLALSGWQIKRLWWKQELIATIQQYQFSKPLAVLPEDTKVLKKMGFQRVILKGEFLHDDEAHLMPRYYNSALGYHILTPFKLIDGRVALVNRGWVGKDAKGDSTRNDLQGEQTIISMVRTDNDRNYFTPKHEPMKNLWFWRDLQAIEESRGYDLIPVNFDLLYDKKSVKDYPIPSDGLVQLRNDHFGYAITWLLIAFSGVCVFFYRHYYVPEPKTEASE